MRYHLHMPSYFWRTFTEYPTRNSKFIIDYLPSLCHSLGKNDNKNEYGIMGNLLHRFRDEGFSHLQE